MARPKRTFKVRSHIDSNGIRRFEGICLRHKRAVHFHGVTGRGTHNGVRMQLAAHLREHQVEDAKRAERRARSAAA